MLLYDSPKLLYELLPPEVVAVFGAVEVVKVVAVFEVVSVFKVFAVFVVVEVFKIVVVFGGVEVVAFFGIVEVVDAFCVIFFELEKIFCCDLVDGFGEASVIVETVDGVVDLDEFVGRIVWFGVTVCFDRSECSSGTACFGRTVGFCGAESFEGIVDSDGDFCFGEADCSRGTADFGATVCFNRSIFSERTICFDKTVCFEKSECSGGTACFAEADVFEGSADFSETTCFGRVDCSRGTDDFGATVCFVGGAFPEAIAGETFGVASILAKPFGPLDILIGSVRKSSKFATKLSSLSVS